MKIIEIKWLSEAAEEAEVLVASDMSGFSVWAFCCPCELLVGETLQAPLAAHEVIAFLTTECGPRVNWQKTLSSWSYNFVATLVNASMSLVDVGGLLIEIDSDIPDNIAEGDWFEFTCVRLDADG